MLFVFIIWTVVTRSHVILWLTFLKYKDLIPFLSDNSNEHSRYFSLLKSWNLAHGCIFQMRKHWDVFLLLPRMPLFTSALKTNISSLSSLITIKPKVFLNLREKILKISAASCFISTTVFQNHLYLGIEECFCVYWQHAKFSINMSASFFF